MWVQWAEVGHTDDTNIALLTSEQGEEFEQCSALAAFIHGQSIGRGEMMSAQVDGEGMEGRHYHFFDGIQIDTCTSRTSVISMRLYHAFSKIFNLPHSMPTDKKSVAGIGGTSRATGVAVMQVPFKELDVVVDILFLVLKDVIPTLLSMKGMLNNGLDISIQG